MKKNNIIVFLLAVVTAIPSYSFGNDNIELPPKLTFELPKLAPNTPSFALWKAARQEYIDSVVKVAPYNYDLKDLYNTPFKSNSIGKGSNITLKQVLKYLSTDTVNVDAFINSEFGEKTAENWYSNITWAEDPMNPNLVDYWKKQGLTKEVFYDKPNDGDGIIGDYYVYTPSDVRTSGKKYPVVILFHGGGEKAFQTETFGFNQIAAKEGLILISPEIYNIGDKAKTLKENQEGVIKMLEKVKQQYSVDESKVYIVGSSAGGANALAFSTLNMLKIAGVGVMDQPVTLDSIVNTTTDEDINNFKEKKLPTVFLGGLADMYGMYNMTNKFYFYHTEGSWDKYITGWNKVMEAYGIKGHDLTVESRYNNSETSLNLVEYWTGLPFDNNEITFYQNNRVYKNTFNKVDTLCSYIEENRPHMPIAYDATYIWNFLSKYSRNMKTGKLKVNK